MDSGGFDYAVLMVVLSFGYCVHGQTVLRHDSRCGNSIGCYHDCKEAGCDFLITWHHRPEVDSVDISMNKKLHDVYMSQWFALGLSDDSNMGDDSVIECAMDELDRVLADVKHSYNVHNYNVDVFQAKSGLRAVSGRVVDGILSCNFTRKIRVVGFDRIFALDRSWHLMAASGFMKDGSKLHHPLGSGGPRLSPVTVDLRQNVNVDADTVVIVPKIHGCLMIFAWVILASISVIVARFYRKTCPASRACGQYTWYQWHKLLMLGCVLVVMAAFVLIWVNVKDFSEMYGSNHFQRAHPVLGVCIMGLTLLNPILAFLRPSSGTAMRPMFRYIHGFVGTTVYLLALLNVAIGVTLPGVSAPSYTVWIVTGFGVYQILTSVILEAHNGYLIKSGKQLEYEMNQMSSGVDSLSSFKANNPPGARFKKLFLSVHVMIVFCVGVTCITLILV